MAAMSTDEGAIHVYIHTCGHLSGDTTSSSYLFNGIKLIITVYDMTILCEYYYDSVYQDNEMKTAQRGGKCKVNNITCPTQYIIPFQEKILL